MKILTGAFMILGVAYAIGSRAGLAQEQLPTPDVGFGHATGVFLSHEGPKSGIPICLVEVDAKDQLLIPTSGSSKVLAITDASGQWVALNVRPGRYAAFTKCQFLPNKGYCAILSDLRVVSAGAVVNFYESGCVSETEGVCGMIRTPQNDLLRFEKIRLSHECDR